MLRLPKKEHNRGTAYLDTYFLKTDTLRRHLLYNPSDNNTLMWFNGRRVGGQIYLREIRIIIARS